MSTTPLSSAAPPTEKIPALAAGSLIADRYRIVAELGEGGMGAVYLVEHVHMRKQFALKVLHEELSGTGEISARFEREAIAAGRIEHPNVAAATDFGKLPGGSFFLVLEYVKGETLRLAIEKGRLDPMRAIRVVHGIAMALSAAHAKGVVHRDLKPENVMLVTHEGQSDFVKVLDFGIAKLDAIEAGASVTGIALTKVGMIIGTPDYMAPEQALGQAIDGRTDLYTVGVMLFELLTGERPFTGGAATVLRQHVVCEAPRLPAAIDARLDPRVAEIVARLLEKAPAARHASAADLLAALDECILASPGGEVALPVVATPASGAHALTREAHTVSAPERSAPGRVPSGVERLASMARLGAAAVAPRARRRMLLGIGGAVVALALLAFALARPGPPNAGAPESAAILPPPPRPTATEASPSRSAIEPAGTESADSAENSRSPATPQASSTAAASTAKASRPATKAGGGRRTGPGGIYIPPPSQWFK